MSVFPIEKKNIVMLRPLANSVQKCVRSTCTASKSTYKYSTSRIADLTFGKRR